MIFDSRSTQQWTAPRFSSTYPGGGNSKTEQFCTFEFELEDCYFEGAGIYSATITITALEKTRNLTFTINVIEEHEVPMNINTNVIFVLMMIGSLLCLIRLAIDWKIKNKILRKQEK